MDWQMRWSLLTFLGGWDDKQDRKMCVKVIIILALMMTKYLAAPWQHNSAQAASALWPQLQSPVTPITIYYARISLCDAPWSSLQFWCLFATFYLRVVSLLVNCKVHGLVWKADVMMSVILIVCSEFEIVNYRRVMNINTKLNSTHRHGCQSQNCWL